jgi:hypothetical protein
MAGFETYRQKGPKPPAWRRWLALTGCVLFCSVGLPVAGFAQDTRAQVMDVASLTLVPLPNETIAVVKGSGLQGPGVGNQMPAGGAITLWDELKPPAASQTTGTGMSVITTNSVAK